MPTTDVLRVPGNYTIESAAGTVTVDAPLTIINGSLHVIGDTTSIETTNSTIKDNLITLNSGEANLTTNGGITAGKAGFMISRGHSDGPEFGAFLEYYDIEPEPGYIGLWSFGSPSNPYGHSLRVGGIYIPQDQSLLGMLGTYNPNAVITVEGTTNYEDNVLHDDHIPNKKYVDDKVSTGEFAKKLKVSNSFIEINDNNEPNPSAYYTATSKIFACIDTTTNIVFALEGVTAQFKKLTLNGSTIVANDPDSDITLTPTGSGLLEIDSGIKIQKTTAIAPSAGFTAIYSTSTVGGGGTGLFYVNTADTDELVSRRRSIVYSIIF